MSLQLYLIYTSTHCDCKDTIKSVCMRACVRLHVHVCNYCREKKWRMTARHKGWPWVKYGEWTTTGETALKYRGSYKSERDTRRGNSVGVSGWSAAQQLTSSPFNLMGWYVFMLPITHWSVEAPCHDTFSAEPNEMQKFNVGLVHEWMNETRSQRCRWTGRRFSQRVFATLLSCVHPAVRIMFGTSAQAPSHRRPAERGEKKKYWSIITQRQVREELLAAN